VTRSFIVLASQRSGSTWLISVLNDAQGVIGHGELFHVPRGSTRPSWSDSSLYPRFSEIELGPRPLATWRYLQDFYLQRGHVGFKLMYSQLWRFPEIWTFMLIHRVSIVHIYRRNHLDTVISSRIKHELGRSHLLSGEEASSVPAVTLDPATILRDLRWLRRKQTLARWLVKFSSLRYFNVAYEDLLSDTSVFISIGAFLGITDPVVDESRLVRIQTRPRSEAISNYKEIKNALDRSEFAEFLE
jgi:LPS sulfotransferase NodH